jgi:hypothetical protein
LSLKRSSIIVLTNLTTPAQVLVLQIATDMPLAVKIE